MLKIINKVLSFVLWLGIILIGLLLLKQEVLSVYETILSIVMITCVYSTTKWKCNRKIKLIFLIFVYALCYLEFVNVNVSIKYMEDRIAPNTELLCMFFCLGYMYCLYQQWNVIFFNFQEQSWKWINFGIVLMMLGLCMSLCLFTQSCIQSHIFIYYIPAFHYVAIITAFVMLQLRK